VGWVVIDPGRVKFFTGTDIPGFNHDSTA